MSLSPTTVKHTGQESGGVQNCQIVIVSAVKICKQCLQTASAFRVLCPQTYFWAFAAGPYWGTSVTGTPGL